MQDCNQRIEQQFVDALEQETLPAAQQVLSLSQAGLQPEQLRDLFESQIMSRQLDLCSRRLQKRGLSFYTIGSAGHEGNAACALACRGDDMAFLHYRSAAFVIQRAKQVHGQAPLYDMLLSFCASAEDPVSGGRHKVLGGKTLAIPPQTSTVASHLPKAVGAAFSIALARKVNTLHPLPEDGVIICSFGDASANHSTAQGAINAAAWAAYQSIPLPLVFICEDNGIGISTPTPQGWIQANFQHKAGLHYLQCNGLDLLDTYHKTRQAVQIARQQHKPVFLHMRTVRLLGHAGSDAEVAYHTAEQIAATEAQDPLLHSARLLQTLKILNKAQILELYQAIRQKVDKLAEQAASRPRLASAAQVTASLLPPARVMPTAPTCPEAIRSKLFAHDMHNLHKKQHLAKLLNWTLMDLMASHDNIVLLGEDVGKKGGVYNVTAKLFERFGAHRVINTLLDEQSILGAAIGLAHNDFMPIPEIQFLAYVHNAEDQIRGEAATLPFFSNGQFSNPMLIRIAGLAYQKGFGGHFHNDNSFAVFRDIPGLILACPSNGADAVEMLRTCVRLAREQQRLVVFLEPIALYMQKDLHAPGDGQWAFDYVPPAKAKPMALGEVGLYGEGKDLCLISYANGYYLCRQAEKILAAQGVGCKIIDLRWLAPLNEQAILAHTRAYRQVLIVDECRQTGSISEAIITLLATQGEQSEPRQQIQRITAKDSFIPLGSASSQVLPSKQEIVDTALAMLGKAHAPSGQTSRAAG